MGVFSYKNIGFLFVLTVNLALSQVAEPEIFKLHSPELNTDKQIRVLLPEGYELAETTYPVIYMHDAQNLFDAATSYAGEWKVDETLDSLRLQFIVVGIDHGNEKRIDELTPYPHPKYAGGQGKAYSDFIVNTLKPEIERRYPVKTGRENTLIAGSSLGGLISHYMLFTHPDVFSGGILFSPSYWYSDKIFELTEKSKDTAEFRIYMVTGALEPDSAAADHQRMTALLRSKGYNENSLFSEIRADAKHNEAFWSKEFPRAILWMMNHHSGNPTSGE